MGPGYNYAAGRSSQVHNVMAYGARGNGTDDTAAITRAIEAAGLGHQVYFPKGRYRINTTIPIDVRGMSFIGDAALRAVDGGTEIVYYGSGSCFEIGTDDSLPWDSALYNGKQDNWFNKLWFSHGAPNTLLGTDGVQNYRPDTYAIRDWRGGGLRIHDCGFERFDYATWGIGSDLNDYHNIWVMYCNHGIYLGPRADQAVLEQITCYVCARGITLDRVSDCTISNCRFVGCGNATLTAIEIRKGSSAVRVICPWFEHLDQGGSYLGTDQLAFVGVGIVDGYGPAGVGTTVTDVNGVDVISPFIYTLGTGIAGHTRYMIALDRAQRVRLYTGSTVAGGSNVFNLDSMIATVTAATGSPTASINGGSSSFTNAQLFVNNAAGATPKWSAWLDGISGAHIMTEGGRLVIRNPSTTAPLGAREMYIGSENQAGQVYIQTPGYASGQTIRVMLWRVIHHGAAAPSTGTWQVGDIILNSAPVAGGSIGWVCTTGGTFPGTPPTFKTWGTIAA